MKHIMHIVWGMGVGGTENMLADIINRQVNSANITLVIVDDVYCQNIISRLDKTINIIYINRRKGARSIFSAVKLNWIIYHEKPDVVHCHTPSLMNVILVKLLGYPIFCVTCHDTQIAFENYHKYDRVFSISDAVKNDLEQRYSQKSELVPNGVDFGGIQRKHIVERNKVFSIVQVSRLEHKKKGQEIMLNAIQYIVNSMGIKNIEYVIIGDGPSQEFLTHCAKDLNISNYCKFLGSLERSIIYSTLKKYDLLVQPSYYEGFGLTAVEGMAACLPVLVSDIDGPLDIVKNGKHGYTFKSGDYLDLARKIIQIMDDYEKPEYQEWILGNYNYAKNNYDVTTTALKYLEMYDAGIVSNDM